MKASIDDILRTYLHNAGSSIRSDLYNVLVQLLWDLLGNHFIGEALEGNGKGSMRLMQMEIGVQKGC